MTKNYPKHAPKQGDQTPFNYGAARCKLSTTRHMSSYITNEGDKNLRDRIRELISASVELKFLVGFFYFSGIQELYSALRDKPALTLKVLVGMEAGNLAGQIVEFARAEGAGARENQRAFLRSIKETINSKQFDTKDFYEQASFFIEMIRAGRLVLRKTHEPNHAKLYVFKMEEGQLKNAFFITGSSNLTYSGLVGRSEFNVEISDFGTEEAEKYFDGLWETADPLTEDEPFREKMISLLERETLVAKVTPFEAYVRILVAYLDTFSSKDINTSTRELLIRLGYTDFRYQLDAVEQALAVIERENGVILADVVGLGKSVIASLVAKEIDARGLIICPPGLMGDRNGKSGWEMYKQQFGLHDWEIRSVGDLESTLEWVRNNNDIEIIVVDEAHRFRNEDTRGYELLSNICRNKKVILLTATPFSNSPSDVFSLLKLFIVPGRSSISIENDLAYEFALKRSEFEKLSSIRKHHNDPDPEKRRRAQQLYENLFEDAGDIRMERVRARTKQLAVSIRARIEPVTIRRNRIDLLRDPKYSSEIASLSVVKDPLEQFFELSEEQSAFYDQVIGSHFADNGDFRGAIYRPYAYEVGLSRVEATDAEEHKEFLSQHNLFDFMRRLLVKRFESSFGAFEKSISNFRRVAWNALRFCESTGKYVLDRNLIERALESDDADEVEAMLEEYAEALNRGQYPKRLKVYDVEAFADRERFLADIRSDIALFDALLEKMAGLKLKDNDPKIAALNRIFEGIQPRRGETKRKIVVFSEYVDTIHHIKKHLPKRVEKRALVVAGNVTTSAVARVLRNFDASSPEKEDDFDILLTTDKLSEGFNLGRAGAIVNYDIPWNPVRVIQRVGRINRIGQKVFDELFIYNFFPTERGADLVRSREIASNKMFLIHNTLGEDAKIFGPEEVPQAAQLYRALQANPEEGLEVSPLTAARNEMAAIEEANPGIVERVRHLPYRIKVAKQGHVDDLVVGIRKGAAFFLRHKVRGVDAAVADMTIADALQKVRCDVDEPAHPFGLSFWDDYGVVIEHELRRTTPLGENSLELRSRNVLRTLLERSELEKWADFLRMLLDDVIEFKTLAGYTLRRIANLEESLEDIDALRRELTQLEADLGTRYLEGIRERVRDASQDVVVAVENRTDL